MDIWLFITLVPKVLYNFFLFVGLTTLGSLMYFYWLIHSIKCPDVSTTNCNLQKSLFGVYSLGMYIDLSAIGFALWITDAFSISGSILLILLLKLDWLVQTFVSHNNDPSKVMNPLIYLTW